MRGKYARHTIAELMEILARGHSWSEMAAKCDYDDGSNFRRYCLSRGLRRQIRGGVVIVIVEPT